MKGVYEEDSISPDGKLSLILRSLTPTLLEAHVTTFYGRPGPQSALHLCSCGLANTLFLGWEKACLDPSSLAIV